MNKIAPPDMRQHLMLNQFRLSTAGEVAQEIEDCWVQPRSFHVMIRVKLDSLLQLAKGPAKDGKTDGVPYNCGRSCGTKGKGKVHKGLGFQPDLCNIMASSVMFRSPTELAAPSTSIFKSVTHEGCGKQFDDRVHSRWKGKIVNDKKCIEQVQQIMGTTPGFDIVYDRGSYVLDPDVNDGVYVNDERRNLLRMTLESVIL